MSSLDIRALFKEEVTDLLNEMEAALLELEDNSTDLELINRVFRAMHTIKGGAAVADFPDVTALTHEAETAFDKVRSDNFPVSRELLNITFSAKDLIWILVEQPEAADASQLEALATAFKAFAQGQTPTIKDEKNPEKEDTDTEEANAEHAEEHPEENPEEDGQEDAEKNGEKSSGDPVGYHISFKPTDEKLLAHADPLGLFEDLRSMSEEDGFHIVPRTDAVPDLDKLDPESCTVWWDIVLTTRQSKNDIQDAFIFFEDSAEIAVKQVDDPTATLAEIQAVAFAPPDVLASAPLPAKTKEAPPATASAPESAPEPAPEPASAPAPEPAPKAAPAAKTAPPPKPEQPAPAPKAAPAAKTATAPDKAKAPAPKKQAAKPMKKETSSIRVDAYKLDDMVSLVGELVIAQARLNQTVSRLNDPGLQAVAEELDLLSAGLRDRTLSMRMLPIGTTFDRFRRLVRDLSHEMGKEIDLVTQGADTELDKTVIEQLGDPMVHLLRNSIDHGIEVPQVRLDAGKSPKGTLLLSAEHSGGHVIIKIMDDGAGLNREKITAKAVERGLVQDASLLSDKDIYNMIFLPGFSTAEKVTNVSGRGVGMDVVKKSIDGLRGSVSINSTPGKGSTITIKLPLTLAIIEGLQVRVGEEFFVIPLSLIVECVELTKTDRGEREGKKIINLRDEIVPYIRLRDWFHIPGERPEIEQIIITGNDGQHTGIAVDEVIGQQQTVIKNIGKIFGQVEEVSGATIKGDGTMALIIDIPSLLRNVQRHMTNN